MKQEFYLAMAVIPVARSHAAHKKMSLCGIMQMLCAIAVIAICFTANAQAQYDNVPELEEWFGMESGGIDLNYLPNFDVPNGGINALTINLGIPSTIYNRYPGDTVNHFTWDISSIVVQGDFNGDGITDYVDYNSRLYLGTENNKPPKRTNKKLSYENLYNIRKCTIVGDFDGDGIDDIFTRASSTESDGCLLLGARDTSQMRIIRFNFYNSGYNKRGLVAAYTDGGKARVISYSVGNGEFDVAEGFYLWDISVDKTGEPTVKFTLLDKIERYIGVKQEPYYSSYNSWIYYDTATKERIFLIGAGTARDMYSIIDDKFLLGKSGSKIGGSGRLIPTGINSSKTTAWCTGVKTGVPDQYSGIYLFFVGSPLSNSFPVAKVPWRYKDAGVIMIVGIGDVSGDDIGDVAITYNGWSGSFFKIFKGINDASGVNSKPLPRFDMGQSIPSPAPREGECSIPITIEKAGHYVLTLYSLTGAEIVRVFEGDISEGSHNIVLEPKLYALSAGMYSLRLSDGLSVRERGFMVGGN
jgi:hypothetical protein